MSARKQQSFANAIDSSQMTPEAVQEAVSETLKATRTLRIVSGATTILLGRGAIAPEGDANEPNEEYPDRPSKVPPEYDTWLG